MDRVKLHASREAKWGDTLHAWTKDGIYERVSVCRWPDGTLAFETRHGGVQPRDRWVGYLTADELQRLEAATPPGQTTWDAEYESDDPAQSGGRP